MYEEAEYYYERVLPVEESKREAFMALGQLEVARGNFKEAIVFLGKAQEVKFELNTQQYYDQVEEAWQSSQ